MATKISGALQSNGDFIFSFLDGSWRKMVLTSNEGLFIKYGYLPKGDISWADKNSWRQESNTQYTVINFKGFKGNSNI